VTWAIALKGTSSSFGMTSRRNQARSWPPLLGFSRFHSRLRRRCSTIASPRLRFVSASACSLHRRERLQVAQPTEAIWELAYHLHAAEPLGQEGRAGKGF